MRNGQRLHQRIHAGDVRPGDSLKPTEVLPGQQYVGKAQPHALRHAALGLRDGANLAAQPDFSHDTQRLGKLKVIQTGSYGKAHGQVGAGIIQFQPARDAHVHILIKQLFTGSLFHHRQQQRHATGIHAAYRAARHVVKTVRGQRLQIAKDGAAALNAAEHHAAAGAARALG